MIGVLCVIGGVILCATILGFAINDASAVEAKIRSATCDDLYHNKYWWSRYGYEKQEQRLLGQCVKPYFPDVVGKPTDLQAKQYFVKMECPDLAVHILKEHFYLDQAKEVYDVKCNTPLESIELPELTFDFTDPDRTPETPKKSDESGYGSQYEKWGRK